MDTLKTVYMEITSECNLSCVMCSRNHWENETTGHMDPALFDRVLAELPDSVEKVFFGGIGEPLFHPEVLRFVQAVKDSGRACEMITNATMLTPDVSAALVAAELDCLWVSMDAMDEKSYERIRTGSSFSGVIGNIREFNRQRSLTLTHNPHAYTKADMLSRCQTALGISFVLMKSNLHQLTELISGAHIGGINKIKVTHLLPYNEEMAKEVCYERVLRNELHGDSRPAEVQVDMPLMDTFGLDLGDLPAVFTRGGVGFSFMGLPLQRREGYCRFVQEGVTFVRWDGEVCPCMALLHENTVWQQGAQRKTKFCSYGNVVEQSLPDIWASEPYAAFRRRVFDFDFSPCTKCGACDLFETNEEDCFGSGFPTCGPCLWAQGLIQCP